MSLYSKKLHIKKPNGVVQTANLYTDKNDVGSNYLTFRDGNNTVFSILDVNGDVDCKISKNNVNYKIKKENVINVVSINRMTPFNFTVPHGITVLKMKETQYLLADSWYKYIKVSPDRMYRFYGHQTDFATDEGHYGGQWVIIKNTITSRFIVINCREITDEQGNTVGNGGDITIPTHYEDLNVYDSHIPVYFEYSNEINKTTTIHADLT